MRTPSDQDELRDAPTLRSIHHTDPFVVPDGFFEDLPTRISGRIAAQSRSRWSLPNWFALASIRTFVAVATVAGVIVATYLFQSGRTGTTNASVAEITMAPTEIDALELDETELLAMMDDDSSLLGEAGDGLSTDEMAQYLENEELSLDLLIEEL